MVVVVVVVVVGGGVGVVAAAAAAAVHCGVMPVDIAALQRQQDDRIAELVGLHEAGLLTAPDLEHAIQRQRESFQRKLLARLDEEDENRGQQQQQQQQQQQRQRQKQQKSEKNQSGHPAAGAASKQQDAETRLRRALVQARDTGEWNSLENAIDDALGAGLPHSNASVVAAFNFIENQLVEGGKHNHNPSSSAAASASRAAAANQPEDDPASTLRQMFDDNLLSAEEYAQALRRLDEEVKGPGEQQPSSTPLTAQRTPRRDEQRRAARRRGVGAQEEPQKGEPTLAQMFDEISSMYRKGHISSPDFARASHLLAHDDDSLSEPEKQEKRILTEMLRQPQAQPADAITGSDDVEEHSDPSSSPPAPRPHRPSPVKQSIAEAALVRQLSDARGGHMSPAFLKHAINVARRTLDAGHPVVEEAQLLHRRLEEESAELEVGNGVAHPSNSDSVVSTKKLQRLLCGLFAAADFESRGAVPVARMVPVCAIRCPRDGRRWKPSRCLQQLQLHIPAANGTVTPASRPQHPHLPRASPAAASSIARRVRMLQDDDDDDGSEANYAVRGRRPRRNRRADMASRSGGGDPAVGPVEFVLYFTHRWHGGMHTFSSDEVDETLLLMHQAVEQQRLRIAADAAAKLEDATHRLHQADGDSGGSKNEEKHTQRQPEQPTLERVKRTAQGTVPRDGAMSSSLRQLLQVHGLAEHAPTMAALGLLHPADCASLNVDEMIECVPALTIPQVRALYKLAAACRARLRRDQEQQQNDERRANRESNDLPRHRPLEDVSPDTVRSSPVDVKGGWSKSPSPPPALSPHSRRNGGPSSSFSPHALNSANVNSTSDVNRPQRHALPGALNRPTPRRLALTDRPSGGPGGPGGQRTGTSVPNPSSGRSQSRSSPPPQLALTAAHPAQKSPSTMVGPFRSGNRSPVLRKTARDHHTPSLFASNAPYGNGSGTSSGGNNSNRNREAPPPARQHQTTTSPSDEALRTSPTKSANDSVPTVRVASPDTVEGQSAALNHSRGDSSGTGVDLDETLPLDAVPTSSPLYRSSGPAPAWIAHHGQSPFLTSQIHADGADLGGVGSQRTQAPPQSSFSTPSQQQQQQQQQQHSQGREPRPHVSPQQVVYPDDRLHRSGPYHSPDRNQQQQQPQQKAQLPILGVDNSTPPNLMDRAVRTELQNVALRLQAMAHGPLSRAEARELRESVSELQSNTRRYLDSRQNQVHNQNASTNTSSHQSGRGGPNIGDDLSCVPHGSPSTTARGAYGRSASPPPELRPGRSPPSRGRRPPSPPPERSVVADSKPELAASLGSLLSSIHATMSRLGSGEEEGVLSDPLRSSWLTTRDLLPDDDDDFEAGTAPADLRELADGLDEILGSVDELHKDAAAAPDLAEQPERPKVSFAPARAFPADPLSTDVAVPYVRPGYIEELERAGYGKQPHEVVVRPWDSAGMGQEPASNQTPNTPVKQQQKNVAQRVAERRAAKVAAARFTPAGGPGTPDLAATGGPGSRGYKSPELQAGKSKPTETKSVNDMVDDVLKSSDDEDDSSSLTSADTRDGEGDEANDRRGDKSASSSASSGEDSEDEEWRRKFKRQDKRLSITKLKQVGRKISPKRGQIREKAKRLEAQGENVVKKHAKKKARKKKRGSDEYSSSSDGESSGSEPDPFTLEKQLEKELGSDKFAVAPVVASPPANGGQSPDDIGQEGSLQHETSQQHQLFYLQYVCKNLDGCGIFELPSYDAGLPRNRRGENTIRQQEIVSAVEEVSGWLKLGDGRGWVPVVSQGGTTVNFVPLHEDEEGVAKDQRPDFETVAVQAIRERAKTVEDAIALEVERDQAVCIHFDFLFLCFLLNKPALSPYGCFPATRLVWPWHVDCTHVGMPGPHAIFVAMALSMTRSASRTSTGLRWHI